VSLGGQSYSKTSQNVFVCIPQWQVASESTSGQFSLIPSPLAIWIGVSSVGFRLGIGSKFRSGLGLALGFDFGLQIGTASLLFSITASGNVCKTNKNNKIWDCTVAFVTVNQNIFFLNKLKIFSTVTYM